MDPYRRSRMKCGGTCSMPALDTVTNSWVSYPGMCMVILSFVFLLLDHCDAMQSDFVDNSVNTTHDVMLMNMTTESIFHLKTNQQGATDIAINDNRDSQEYTITTISQSETQVKDDLKSNDVRHNLGLNLKTTALVMATSVNTPTARTHRDIYIRGHLLKHPPPGRKTFHPPETSGGLFREPGSVHFSRVHNFRDDDEDESNNRKKRKHSADKERFYNYKLLYDTIKDGRKVNFKRTEFYAWIFGAAMLSLTLLTAITFSFVFCFCGDRARKKRTARPRRPHDKAGEYERVGSVSSIVDYTGEPLDTIYEENIDNVTII